MEMYNTPKHDEYDIEKKANKDDDISMIPDHNFTPAISVKSEILSR